MKKIVITLLTILSLSSCSDFLSQEPTDAIPDNRVPTPGNAVSIFNGTWKYMFDTFYTYANPGFGALLRQDDMMGNDIVAYSGKYGFTASYQFNDVQIKTDYRARSFWTIMYKVIDNCNWILSITSKDPDDNLERAQGMAYALRAYVYFTLAQHYQFTYQKDKTALCVPVYTTPSTSTTTPAGRSTVEQVYSRILEDLTNAVSMLDGKQRISKFEPNSNVVNGLLARVYLVMGEWDKAATAAAAAREGYPLMPAIEYSGGFNNANNQEWIWGHPQTADQNTASYLFNYIDVVSPQSGYYSFMADPHFKELFTDPNDARLNLFEWVRNGYLAYKKFLFRSDNTGDIVLMRSAEMYLIEAEAKARSASYSLSDAVVPLNNLRQARGVSDYSITGKTEDEVINEIATERRRELWGEGFSLTDILRLQKPVERTAYAGADVECRQIPGNEIKSFKPQGHWILKFPNDAAFTANSTYYLYSIPETEVNANPGLNQ